MTDKPNSSESTGPNFKFSTGNSDAKLLEQLTTAATLLEDGIASGKSGESREGPSTPNFRHHSVTSDPKQLEKLSEAVALLQTPGTNSNSANTGDARSAPPPNFRKSNDPSDATLLNQLTAAAEELDKDFASRQSPQISRAINITNDDEKPKQAIVAVLDAESDESFTWDQNEEADVRKIMDLKVIPWVTLMYLLSFLDRANIGNARVVKSNAQGVGEMEADLGLVGDQYNWAVSVFFIGYVIFEVPSNLLLKRLKPSRWLSRIMVTWGITATCLAASNSFATIAVIRIILGICEAGLFPGVLFYLSFWYRKHELARRMSWFIGGASAAGAFGGVFAYGIAQLGGAGGLKGWQWVFIIEGLPTIVVGILTWFILPDFPSTAKFFTERQRKIATLRLKKEHIDPDEVHFDKSQFNRTISDSVVWLYMFIYICLLVPLYSISFFLPTIIRGLGYTSLQAQAFSSPPFVAACLFTIVIGFSSDYFQNRGYHLLFGAALAAISFFSLAFVRNQAALYALTFTTAMGVYSSLPSILSWVSNNLTGSTRGATGMAMVVGFGNIGGAIAGQVYRSTDANYQWGHTANGILMCFVFLLTASQIFNLKRINKKRDAALALSNKNEENNGSANGSKLMVSDSDELIPDTDIRFRYQL